MRRRALALSLGLALWLAAFASRADAPPMDEWPVERNAQLLRQRETRLGLFGLDVGVHERFQVGTLWPTWALLGPNLHLKGLLLDRGPVQLALDTSFFYLNLARLRWFGVDDVSGEFLVLPVDLFLDVQLHARLLAGVGTGYSLTHTTPAYDPKQFSGAGAYDSWLARAHLTARASKRLWLVLEVDWILYQLAGAAGSVDTQVNEYVSVSGRAQAVVSSLDPGRGGAATLSMVTHLGPFGFRFGLGYGHFVLPRVRIVVPTAIPFFTLDMFARFGGR